MKNMANILLLTLLFNTFNLHAQWMSTVDFNEGPITSLAVNGNDIVAGVNSGNIFLSTSSGSSWAKVNSAWPESPIRGSQVVFMGGNLFAGILLSGVFVSTNNGSTWNAVNQGLADLNVLAFSTRNEKLFAMTDLGLHVSTDNGNNWRYISTLQAGYYGFHLFTVTDINIFVKMFSHHNGGNVVYKSTDDGVSWNTVFQAGTNATNSVTALAAQGSNVYLGIVQGVGTIMDGVLLSTDNGITWKNANNGLPKGTYPTSFAITGPNLFAATSHGIYFSDDNASTWKSITDTLVDTTATALYVDGTYIYMGTQNGRVWFRSLKEITKVGQFNNSTPERYSLEQNFPNPFNPTTTIQFSIGKDAYVNLDVFDLLGRKVQVIISGARAKGTHRIIFSGKSLSSGIYFVKLQADRFIEVRKIVLTK